MGGKLNKRYKQVSTGKNALKRQKRTADKSGRRVGMNTVGRAHSTECDTSE